MIHALRYPDGTILISRVAESEGASGMGTVRVDLYDAKGRRQVVRHRRAEDGRAWTKTPGRPTTSAPAG